MANNCDTFGKRKLKFLGHSMTNRCVTFEKRKLTVQRPSMTNNSEHFGKGKLIVLSLSNFQFCGHCKLTHD